MTQDILKTSLADSIRYLQAYDEGRLRNVEDIWSNLDLENDAEPRLQKPEPAAEIPPSKTQPPQAEKERSVEITRDTDNLSPSFLQRLLGW